MHLALPSCVRQLVSFSASAPATAAVRLCLILLAHSLYPSTRAAEDSLRGGVRDRSIHCNQPHHCSPPVPPAMATRSLCHRPTPCRGWPCQQLVAQHPGFVVLHSFLVGMYFIEIGIYAVVVPVRLSPRYPLSLVDSPCPAAWSQAAHYPSLRMLGAVLHVLERLGAFYFRNDAIVRCHAVNHVLLRVP